MNEKLKTLMYVATAVVVALFVWFTRPMPSEGLSADLGAKFYPDFRDPLTARSLEIVRYDEQTDTPEQFEVTHQNGVWTIPSHSGYPADAEKQLAQAAASVIDLKKLSVASTSPADHETYGVVDPDPTTLKVGSTGVGQKVVLKGEGGKVLAQYIIGTSPPNRRGLRYVRIPGEDPTYLAEIKTDKLSTKFGDWIEKDLLKLKSFDIEKVSMYDYSVDEVNGRIENRSRFTVDYDGRESKWSLESLEIASGKDWKPEELGADEELNTAKLDELKAALDDLQIIDVVRKPPGLSANLRAGDTLLNNREAIVGLAQRGFYVAKVGDVTELFSNDGEVRCGTIGGVEYVLRFGEITTRGGSEKKDEGDEAADKDEPAASSGGQNRFIMVSAQFNENLIAKPEIEALPELPAAEVPKAGDAKADESKSDEEKKPADEKPKDDKADKAMRAAIEKENQRKLDEYYDKVKKGEESVKQLNDRFADWYYVISDATYRKIHLSRADLVKSKTAGDKQPADSVEAFDQLKSQGLPQ